MRKFMPFLALPLVLFSACTDTELDGEDAIDGSFAAGKADGFEVLEGTPAATGIMKLVNEASASSLREYVGLSKRAAESIVAARKGADGELLTEDDAIVWTLDELDALPYVGITALRRLHQFAHAEGYVTDSFRSVYYTYGTALARSRLYLLDDGTGYVEDEIRGGAGLLERAQIDGVPDDLVDELRELIVMARDGELEETTLPVREDGAQPVGTLTVYAGDGASTLIDSYVLEETGGERAVLHTSNTLEAADEIRAVARDLVRVTMPE